MEDSDKNNTCLRIEKIGDGAFSQVYKVINKLDNKLYAQKIIQYQNDVHDKHTIENEIEIMQTCTQCDQIVDMYDIHRSAGSVYITMELGFASLYRVIHTHFQGRVIDNRAIAYYMREIASGLSFLHSKDILYRDLKPENIIVMFDGSVKLADFGLSICSVDVRTTICGTVEFLAPEVLFDKMYTKSADIFSMGILLFEMIYTQHPFYNIELNNEQGTLTITHGTGKMTMCSGKETLLHAEDFMRLKEMNIVFPTKMAIPISLKLKAVLRRMLCHERDRISADENRNGGR